MCKNLTACLFQISKLLLQNLIRHGAVCGSAVQPDRQRILWSRMVTSGCRVARTDSIQNGLIHDTGSKLPQGRRISQLEGLFLVGFLFGISTAVLLFFLFVGCLGFLLLFIRGFLQLLLISRSLRVSMSISNSCIFFS